MLATAIRIHTRLKANIRAVVSRDDRPGSVAEELRLATRLLLFIRGIHLNDIDIAQIDMKFFESIGRTPGSAPAVDRWRRRRRFLDDRHKLLFSLFEPLNHALSSHEHRPLSSDQVDRPLRGRCYLGAEGAFLLSIEQGTARSTLPTGTTMAQFPRRCRAGGVVERLMAPVLKTGRAKALVGSNPTPSAIQFRISDCGFRIVGGIQRATKYAVTSPMRAAHTTSDR